MYWSCDDVEDAGVDWEGQELLEIKEYFDSLVEAGRLGTDYYWIDNDTPLEDWEPEKGDDYWDKDHFMFYEWEADLSAHFNLLKIESSCPPEQDPVLAITQVLCYSFVNENLLRQAFTRRAFAIEYGLSGSNEELEFLGDMVLNTVVTREITNRFMCVEPPYTDAPYTHSVTAPNFDEGILSRIRQQFVCKEHLASRCALLGLDKFILYGTGEDATESSREDAMEALIGAVMTDCNWNWKIVERVIDNLICVQLDMPDRFLKKSYYDVFNAWHQKHFGEMPDYDVDDAGDGQFYCILRYFVPENDKGIPCSQRIDIEADSRSAARNLAAELACDFIQEKGLWINLRESGIKPDLDNSINQLQELFQKKYLEEKPAYEFEEIRKETWVCTCSCGGVSGIGKGENKTKAKKMASYMALVRLFVAAGIMDNKELDKLAYLAMK